MQSTHRGLSSWWVKVAVLGSIMLGSSSTLPIVYAQTVSPGGFDFVVMGDMPYATNQWC
jgi:hypothetical protein